jgi:hypothetical protein
MERDGVLSSTEERKERGGKHRRYRGDLWYMELDGDGDAYDHADTIKPKHRYSSLSFLRGAKSPWG